MEASRYSLEGFKPLLLLTETLGALLMAMTLAWTLHFRGGFAWRSEPKVQFNWHPVLMVAGMVFLYANGMLLYRTQRTVRKRRLKLLHGGTMLFTVLLSSIGLIAVYDSHNLNKPEPIPNLYSIHSWIGLTTLVLFACQWIVGCVSFLYPGVQANLREVYMPIHVYFGTAGFVGAVSACLLGLSEKAMFTLGPKYSLFIGEAILINIIGLVLVVFGGLTVYLVSQERYRRLPKPEDEALLTGSAN